WNQVLGNVGDPTILDFFTGAAIPVTPSASPNAAGGRIVLAKPALTGDPLKDVLYQGWLYVAAVNGDGSFNGLFVTKDLGQNWTLIHLPVTPDLYHANTNDT